MLELLNAQDQVGSGFFGQQKLENGWKKKK
jgi:hypothetical protein